MWGSFKTMVNDAVSEIDGEEDYEYASEVASEPVSRKLSFPVDGPSSERAAHRELEAAEERNRVCQAEFQRLLAEKDVESAHLKAELDSALAAAAQLQQSVHGSTSPGLAAAASGQEVRELLEAKRRLQSDLDRERAERRTENKERREEKEKARIARIGAETAAAKAEEEAVALRRHAANAVAAQTSSSSDAAEVAVLIRVD